MFSTFLVTFLSLHQVGLGQEVALPKILDIYWESYLNFPYDLELCMNKTNAERDAKEIPEKYFGSSIRDVTNELPDDVIVILSIAFAQASLEG